MKNEFFLSYKDYLSRKYGKPAFRIGVDGGFSCPNRGIDRTRPGCSFCAEEGARSPYTTGATKLEDQISQGKSFLSSRYGAEAFLLYFQAFSSTFAPLDHLRELYDRGLACGPFRELIVSTRPDCVDPGVADLLASYQTSDFNVWVELGLQSSCDRTLERIHRGHTARDYERAALALRERGIKVAPHVIYGLPGEGLDHFLESVRFVVDLGLEGIKFHNLILPPGTELYRDWQEGLAQQPPMEEYLLAVIRGLELVPPEAVVIRLSTDYPGTEEDLPGEVWPKNKFFNQVVQEMARQKTRQGRLYG